MRRTDAKTKDLRCSSSFSRSSRCCCIVSIPSTVACERWTSTENRFYKIYTSKTLFRFPIVQRHWCFLAIRRWTLCLVSTWTSIRTIPLTHRNIVRIPRVFYHPVIFPILLHVVVTMTSTWFNRNGNDRRSPRWTIRTQRAEHWFHDPSSSIRSTTTTTKMPKGIAFEIMPHLQITFLTMMTVISTTTIVIRYIHRSVRWLCHHLLQHQRPFSCPISMNYEKPNII